MNKLIYEDKTLKIRYLGNCAVLIKYGAYSVLADGIFSDDNAFSPPDREFERVLYGDCVSGSIFDSEEGLSEPDVLPGAGAQVMQRAAEEVPTDLIPTHVFFTHKHGDHYDKEKTQRFRKLHPEAEIILPGEVPIRRKFAEDFRIETLKCGHMGESKDPNWAYNIVFPDANVIITGDMELSELPKLAAFKHKDTAIAFFNPMALWHRKCRDDINALKLDKVFFYHLADEGCDRFGYRAQSLRYWQKFGGEMKNGEILVFD